MGFIADVGKEIAGGLLIDPVTNLFGEVTGANQAANAAQQAAQTQSGAAQAGINEQRRQFDAIQALLAPYAQGGQQAFGQQGALLGLNGTGQQQQAYAALESSPAFQALFRQGENAILQNASATGGLRGGNVQGALAQFRPSLLNQFVGEQFNRLGGLTNTGLNAATQTGAQGSAASANIAGLLGQQGAALAGGQLAQGARQGQLFNQAVGLGGLFAGFGGF